MARIGFTRRRTIAYLYAWTLMLAGLALALRFIPYSDHHGHLHTGWTLVLVALGLLVRGRERLPRLRARDPQVPPPRRRCACACMRPEAQPTEIERDVARDLETGEMDASRPAAGERDGPQDHGGTVPRVDASGAPVEQPGPSRAAVPSAAD